MSRRVIIADVYALQRMTPGLVGQLVDAGLEIIVPDYVYEDQCGEIDPRMRIVETSVGARLRNAWELWWRAGRPDDLQPAYPTDDERAWALWKLLKSE